MKEKEKEMIRYFVFKKTEVKKEDMKNSSVNIEPNENQQKENCNIQK